MREELAFVRRYLEIEEVRFQDRLRIRLKRVDILNCDAMLPSIQLFL